MIKKAYNLDKHSFNDFRYINRPIYAVILLYFMLIQIIFQFNHNYILVHEYNPRFIYQYDIKSIPFTNKNCLKLFSLWNNK